MTTMYLFRCKLCGHEFDIIKKRCSSADDDERCCDCGGQMSRVMRGVCATFKGTGFYSTGG